MCLPFFFKRQYRYYATTKASSPLIVVSPFVQPFIKRTPIIARHCIYCNGIIHSRENYHKECYHTNIFRNTNDEPTDSDTSTANSL